MSAQDAAMTDCGWKESKGVAMTKTESKIQISLSRAATPDEDRKRLSRQGRLAGTKRT